MSIAAKLMNGRTPCWEAGGASLWLLGPSWLAVAGLVWHASWFWGRDPSLEFGWVVLILSGYLVAEPWAERPTPSFRWTALAVGCGLAGVLVLAVTQIYHAGFGVTQGSMTGIGVGTLLIVASNLAYVFGPPGMLRLIFPFCFLLLAVPLPPAIQAPVTDVLRSAVVSFDVVTLRLLGVPASRVGNLIHLAAGTVGVDEACSGIRGIQSCLMIGLFVGYICLKSWSLRAVALVGAMALALGGNWLRTLLLSWFMATSGKPAIERLHDRTGWGIVVLTAGGTFLFCRLLRSLEACCEVPCG